MVFQALCACVCRMAGCSSILADVVVVISLVLLLCFSQSLVYDIFHSTISRYTRTGEQETEGANKANERASAAK